MATHNGGKFLKQQLESILVQIDHDDEIIISDDGSNDNTIEIIHSFNDNRIRLDNFIQPACNHKYSIPHRKATANFENAIIQAKGEFIFLSDQDDIWMPGRVDIMKKSLENNTLVIDNFLPFTNGIIAQKPYFHNNPISIYFLYNLIKMPFFGSAMAFRKELLQCIIPFPKNLILHDNWIGFIAHKVGKIHFIQQPLHYYRIHENNTSKINRKNTNPLWYKIFYRMQFLAMYISHHYSTK